MGECRYLLAVDFGNSGILLGKQIASPKGHPNLDRF